MEKLAEETEILSTKPRSYAQDWTGSWERALELGAS